VLSRDALVVNRYLMTTAVHRKTPPNGAARPERRGLEGLGVGAALGLILALALLESGKKDPRG
jgi:hypothetical protein